MGQQLKIHKLNLHKNDELSDEDVPQPIILIQIGLERKIVKALIDTRLDCNTISYELFQQLNRYELQETQVLKNPFIGQCIQAHFAHLLSLFIDELMCKDMFMVTQSCM